MILQLAAFATAILVPRPVTEAPLGTYAELSSDALLPPIWNELRQKLTEPYSIRDFQLSPASKVKLKDERPDRWLIEFSFNSKNSFGGNTGIKAYAVSFREGRIRGGVVATQFEQSDGIEGHFNKMVTRRLATCPHVPDEKIQQLFSPGASPFRQPSAVGV